MGYVNHPEQNEIMLCDIKYSDQNIITYDKTIPIQLLHTVSYRRYGKDWRMKQDKKTIVVSLCRMTNYRLDLIFSLKHSSICASHLLTISLSIFVL